MKNPNDPIKDQTRNLLACSMVPQPTMSTHTPNTWELSILSIYLKMQTVAHITK